MRTLKNKNLIKPTKKLIFIISILMIVALNLFGAEEEIKFEYYYYTNKLYHSTLKTEIIPSEYVFIETYSNKDYNRNLYSFLYNLKTKEKKLFYVYKYINNKEYEYYDINGNLTTNWTDENMSANYFYEITNNRFGETFYTPKLNSYYSDDEKIKITITKRNGYIQKAYKYSLTQPEIINKKDRGIYLFKNRKDVYGYGEEFISMLCFQNEYYRKREHDGYSFYERELLNYNLNGDIEFVNIAAVHYHYTYDKNISSSYSFSGNSSGNKNVSGYDNMVTNYFNLNNKIFSKPKPSYEQKTNNILKLIMSKSSDLYYYTTEDMKENLEKYKIATDVKFIGFIPIEEFEYYLLAD
ncbi:hypothetical protein [Brachyspira catarrhinii]|uniref:Uncharacterized protein n=1 Tax=Brachyspira catarrhinii TaxID=2528966 RepID=A0ABY2TTB8_9SPIR|nr:hypothetical protein [Brachyspira catarrhinii]TKZ36019.1 hypothetical protein EZH24_02250 [Brachyspira catarrhinii]